MKRFLPYFKYFKPVKWQLLGSVLSGLVYAAATGAGLPLAAKVVFPLIFKDDQVNLGEGEPENSFFVEGLMSWFDQLPGEWLLPVACAWLLSGDWWFSKYLSDELLRVSFFGADS